MKAISVVLNRIIMSQPDVQNRRRVGFEKCAKFEESLTVAASSFTLESTQFGLTATVGAMGRVKSGFRV